MADGFSSGIVKKATAENIALIIQGIATAINGPNTAMKRASGVWGPAIKPTAIIRRAKAIMVATIATILSHAAYLNHFMLNTLEALKWDISSNMNTTNPKPAKKIPSSMITPIICISSSSCREVDWKPPAGGIIEKYIKKGRVNNITALSIRSAIIKIPVIVKMPLRLSLPIKSQANPTKIGDTRFRNGIMVKIYPRPPSHLYAPDIN